MFPLSRPSKKAVHYGRGESHQVSNGSQVCRGVRRIAHFYFSHILYLAIFNNANTPKLSIPVPSYDFGPIPEGRTVQHAFIFKNTGQAPLKIISATPDCNCTEVRLSTNLIEAGKQGEITVTYNSQKQKGSFTKLVIIETNDPVEPIKMIKIKGTVIKEDA